MLQRLALAAAALLNLKLSHLSAIGKRRERETLSIPFNIIRNRKVGRWVDLSGGRNPSESP